MKNGEQPAFPLDGAHIDKLTADNLNKLGSVIGLTKREYFAGQMMKHFVDAGWTDYVTAAKNSIDATDALLKALDKQQ